MIVKKLFEIYTFRVINEEILNLDRLESTHWWYLARKAQLSEWCLILPTTSHILDLGSATGGNSLLMQKAGFRVSSLEYSDLGFNLQQQKGIPVTKGDARNLPFKNASFDAVICLDVIEHILEDNIVVLEIARVLRPGGFFLISVPEDPKLWSDHDVAVSHIRRYSRDTIIGLISNVAELDIDSVFSSNYLIKPLVKIFRKFQRGSSLKEMPKMLNFVFLKIAELERRLGLKKIQGMTIWVSGRKN